ncbi:MAG: OadG family protein [Synergistaceae bacterium]|jgi:sodium pump decarboxylase gamma subunit|nr:OadG family protein [Synergistaceae bacterium]
MGSVSSHFVGASGGLLMSVIAFSIVFLVIIGLMLVMMGLKHFVTMINSGDASAPKQTAPARQPEAPVSQTAAAVSAEPGDEELVAVITAAITAATGTAARVLSFSPATAADIRTGRPTSAWRMAAILSNSRGMRD